MINGLVLVLVALGLILQGCAPALLATGAAAEAGAVAYANGNLETTYAAPFDRTWNATLETLREIHIPVTDTDRDIASGTIEAERSIEKEVTVKLESAGTNTTSASIRVGALRDEELPRAIYSRILTNL
jgi:hypothetical protein